VKKKASDFEDFPTIEQTLPTTAILQAGRISLDNNSKSVIIIYDSNDQFKPTRLKLE